MLKRFEVARGWAGLIKSSEKHSMVLGPSVDLEILDLERCPSQVSLEDRIV